MAVTYGFYNSLNGDRTYNAEQMSAIFDGIITDGVFSTIGDALMTIAGTGMQVIVKTGKCWFNSTWTLNDAPMTLAIDTADVSLTRIDAVVLEVNSGVSTRANSIKILKGTPSANPAKPALASDEDLHQYALAYVTVGAGVTSIAASNIEVNVGKTTCPFITSVLQQTSITDLFNAWDEEFNTWFENLQSQMEGDVATNLQNQIDGLKIGSTAKAQYNLTSSLPNDYIEWIGKYNEYWWRLLHGQAGIGYREKRTSVVGSSDSIFVVDTYQRSLGSNPLQYSKEINIDQSTGAVSLKNPQTITISVGDQTSCSRACEALQSLAPCYVKGLYKSKSLSQEELPGVYYFPNGLTYAYSEVTTTLSFVNPSLDSGGFIRIVTDSRCTNPVSLVSSEAYSTPAGDTTYEHSMDRNAYPDSGTVDGITYTFLGKPFENLITPARIETGTYYGTGTYGSSNPNYLTFSFVPDVIFISSETSSVQSYSVIDGVIFVDTPIISWFGSNDSKSQTYVTASGSTVSWYNTNSWQWQFNGKTTYHYIALGR